jgi:outer membrane biosynthesis protein TonB
MVEITLNFKTIEAARQALLDIPASALVGGPEPEALGALVPAPVPAPKAKQKAAPAEVPKPVEVPAPAAPTPAPVAAPEPAPAPVAAPEPAPAPVQTVDYATLQKAVFALAGKSREAAAGVAASLGVKTFKELPEDKWAEALGAVQEKLAELEG